MSSVPSALSSSSDQHETVRLHKDGRQVDVSLSVSPIESASGVAMAPAARGPARCNRSTCFSAISNNTIPVKLPPCRAKLLIASTTLADSFTLPFVKSVFCSAGIFAVVTER